MSGIIILYLSLYFIFIIIFHIYHYVYYIQTEVPIFIYRPNRKYICGADENDSKIKSNIKYKDL